MALGGSARLRLTLRPPGHKPRSVSTGLSSYSRATRSLSSYFALIRYIHLWEETHDRPWRCVCRKVGNTSPIDQRKICAACVSNSYCSRQRRFARRIHAFRPGVEIDSLLRRAEWFWPGQSSFRFGEKYLSPQERLRRKLANLLDMG